jgi:hypothetical protein
MKEPEELIWDAVTESAKRKFDFPTFKAGLGNMADDTIADNIIIMVVAGHASKRPDKEITELINTELLLLAVRFPAEALEQFVKDTKTVLKDEIRAADIALTLLHQGAQVPGVLAQVKSMLKLW